MINKEFIVKDGAIYKDFIDRNIPQYSNNQVCVSVLIPAGVFVGNEDYSVILAVGYRQQTTSPTTTLNTLVMTASKSITIDGVLYVKYSAILSYYYTENIGQLLLSPYIRKIIHTQGDYNEETQEYEDVALLSLQNGYTHTQLNVIKSVLPQYDASLENPQVVDTLNGKIEAKKIYTFIDGGDNASQSIGEHYYKLVNDYNPQTPQFSGCLVLSIYGGWTNAYIPYLNNGNVELLEITSNGVFNKISDVSYADSTYTYTKQKLSYTKSELDSALNLKADKSITINGYDLSEDRTLTKGDVGLGNVVNYGVETTPTITGDQLYITSKGVYDALQLVYTAISGCATDEDLTTINNRLDSIESIIGSDDGDADSVINTLKEVIVVLNGLGEGASLLDLINAKANQSDLTALNNQINGENGIKDKVDLLSERTNAYMEIKNSLGTIDIAVSDWVENTGDTNYPYKWELTNGYLEGAVNCIVVYSKDSDTSMLSATTGIDETNGKLIVYASELPTETISIEKIAVFNDLNAYINYSNEIVQQVLQNTSAISDINNTKLPLYELKQESLGSGYGTKTQAISSGVWIQQVRKGTGGALGQSRFRQAHDEISIEYTPDGTNSPKADITIKKETDNSNAYIEMNTNSHTLKLDSNGLTLDGNAVGGGKQLYQHNISVSNSSFNYHIAITIINDDQTEFTLSNLISWFNTKGYNTTNKLYTLISGGHNYSNVLSVAYGAYYESNAIKVLAYNQSSVDTLAITTNNASNIKDVVVAL